MKLDEYKQAQNIMQRMDEYEKMSATLRDATQKVKGTQKMEDAQQLAQMIVNLVKTKDGERVVDYIVNEVAFRMEKAKRELQEMFNEL